MKESNTTKSVSSSMLVNKLCFCLELKTKSWKKSIGNNNNNKNIIIIERFDILHLILQVSILFYLPHIIMHFEKRN